MNDKKFTFNWQLYFGIMLLVTGGLFLADRLLGLPLMEFLWPALIIFFGLTFLIGMLVAGKKGAGLAIPGSVVTLIGLLIFIQNTFDLWVTWTYAWGLIIVAVGVGMLIMNLYLKRVGLRRVAGLLIGIGLVLFVIFGVFFEIILNLSGSNMNSGLFLGGGLVLLGLFVIFSRVLFRKGTRGHAHDSGPVVEAESMAADGTSVEVTGSELVDDGPIPSPSPDNSKSFSLSGDFTGLHFKSIGEVILMPGEACDLRIEGGDVHLSKIETRITDGMLYITYKSDVGDWTGLDWVREGGRLRYFVTIKTLERINLAGAGNIIADNFTGRALALSHAGAGKMTLKNLDYQNLTVDLSGLGEVNAAGSVNRQTVTIGGAGGYQAESLKSNVCAVLLTGAGEAKVWVEEDLNANITGAGTIKYKGSPNVEQSNSGLGSIKPF